MVTNPTINQNDQIIPNNTNSTEAAKDSGVAFDSSADGPDLNKTKTLHDEEKNKTKTAIENMKN